MALSEIKMTMSLATAGVTTALDKAKTGVAGFTTSALEKLNSVAKLASGALVAGFTVAAKGALSYGKELENLAQVSNTSVEDFQYFAAGARTVGIENEKLADIFKDVNDKIGDFLQAGSGPMVDFFENIAPAIGVTADEFKNLSGPQALQLYYDSLQKANLSQQEMTFYMEAIASDTTALIPLLQNGGAGFKEFGDRARESGLIMDEVTAKSLKNAELAIDNLGVKTKIMAGEVVTGFQFIIEGIRNTNFVDLLKSYGELILGFTSKDFSMMKNGADGIKAYFEEVDHAASQAYSKMHGYAEGYESSVSSLMNSLTTTMIDDIITTTEADRKAKAEQERLAKSLASVEDKLHAEKMKQLGLRNETEEQLKILQQELIAIEEKHLAWLNSVPDPTSDASQLKHQEFLLEAEQKRTEIMKTQATLDKEAVAAAKEEQEKMTRMLELELERAIASGDQDRIAAARLELDIHNQMLVLMERHNMTDKEALALINEQIKREQERIDTQRELFDAQIAGDDLAIMAAQKKIELEEKALSIMEEFKVSYDEAKDMAEDWLRMMAGADLNNSGFTTFFEQREFDRIQEERQQILDEALAAEEREQREQGGNIRNVSEERGDTGSVWDRAAAAAEEKLRRAENARINLETDPAKKQALIEQIEEDRKQRQLEMDQLAFEEKLKNERDDDEKKRLEALEEQGIFEKDGQLFDQFGNPVDENGQPIQAPKKPQSLDDVVEKMDEIHKTIKSIDKSLKCDP